MKFVNNIVSVKDFISLGFFNSLGYRSFKNLDYFIRFENLNDDFKFVCEKIGIPKEELPHYNKSEHEHYSTYYDEELINLVKNHFNIEIKYFGYKFAKD